jgi:hypothetical protein
MSNIQKRFQFPLEAGKEVKMHDDVFNLGYGKARQRMYLEEADARRLLKTLKTENEEKVEAELAPRKEGFLGLLGWIFRPKSSAEV